MAASSPTPSGRDGSGQQPSLAADMAMPVPFTAPSSTAQVALNLDGARVPPIEALTPMSGLDFGSALELGPTLLLVNLVGLATLAYLVRRRWMSLDT